MDFDRVIVALGGFGRYQKFLFILTGLIFGFGGLNNLVFVFIAAKPENWWCTEPAQTPLVFAALDSNVTSSAKYTIAANHSSPLGKLPNGRFCEVDVYHGNNTTSFTREACTAWRYDQSTYHETLVTKFNLVCGLSETFGKLVASVFALGQLCGVFTIGIISDRHGRKPALIIAAVLGVVGGVGGALSPCLSVFLVTRFLSGVASLCAGTVAYTIQMEVSEVKARGHLGIAVNYFWVFCYFLTGFLGWMIRDWLPLQLITHVPYLLEVPVAIFCYPESPRWLLTKGRREEAKQILQRIAQWNKREFTDELIDDVVVEKQKSDRGSILDMVYFWFTCALIFYGLSWNSSELGSDPFISFFIAAAVEVPSYIVSQFLLSKIGRRLPLGISLMLTGLLLLLTAIPFPRVMIVVLAMAGKLVVSMSFAICYVYTSELNPTIVRNMSLGFCSTFARVGSLISPFVFELSRISIALPLIAYGSVAVSAGFVTLLLPETHGQTLPASLDEADEMPFSAPCAPCCGGGGDNVVHRQNSDDADVGAPTELQSIVGETTHGETAANGRICDDECDSTSVSTGKNGAIVHNNV